MGCGKRDIIDWVCIFCMAGAFLVLHYTGIEPHHQVIPSDSASFLSYPVRGDTVSTEGLFIYTLAPPLLLLIFNVILFKCNFCGSKNALNESEGVEIELETNAPDAAASKIERDHIKNGYICHYFDIFIRCIFFTGLTTMVVTEIIKLCVGRPRPDFLNNEAESRTSYPSLHTSFSITILVQLTKFLLNSIYFADALDTNIPLTKKSSNKYYPKQKSLLITTDTISNRSKDDSLDLAIVVSKNGASGVGFNVLNAHSWFLLPLWLALRDFRMLRIVLAFLPTYLGMYISCSRITDYRHFYSDVNAGALIGVVITFVTEHLYYDQIYGNLNWIENKDYNGSNGNGNTNVDSNSHIVTVEMGAVGTNEKN